ncbi:septum formation family protein [Micromonospora sp. NBC_01813]|uniref:septum formation family protein n=1 Tax=Micromonospora sp. NBC_01813 TaxID=2975988 RepID=UPI002DDA1900|nr:septum formation family protein [Micromonospora sp. NBC_01813]
MPEPLDCDSPHQAEFVGAYVEERLSFRDLQSNHDAVHDRCRSELARYAGVPDDGDLQYRAGTIYTYPTAADWLDGDRTIRCFVWRADPLLTR